MKSLAQGRLFFHTARYLSLSQFWYRAKRLLRKRWWQWQDKPIPHCQTWTLVNFEPLYLGLSDLQQNPNWQAFTAPAVQQATAIAQGCFQFLNNEVAFDAAPQWHNPKLSHLWRYHLHYFDYVTQLLVWQAVQPENDALPTFQKLALSWIAENGRYAGDGWHPYTISLRTVNWLHAVHALRTEPHATKFLNTLLSSLYGQAKMLFSDLELDVRGNHLIENLRALIWAGTVFAGEEPQRWRQRALELLERETAAQILPDGGHFERTPGYHLVILKDYLEIGLFLQRNQQAVPYWLKTAVQQMADYLLKIISPDGNVPLLKDTARQTMLASPQELLTSVALFLDDPKYKTDAVFGLYSMLLWGCAGWQKQNEWPVHKPEHSSRWLPDSGYIVMRDKQKQDYLIVDVGKVCPDYLPAHAHADALSYELTINSKRFIVDSGVYEYTAGLWRNYFRSTPAHNTVAVAEQNQSEVWGSFRVARRAQTKLLTHQFSEQYQLMQAEHNGYRRLSPAVIHRRTIYWHLSQYWLWVDELWGTGTTNATSFIHLHPNITAHRNGRSSWQITGSTQPFWLSCFGSQTTAWLQGQLEPNPQGWYSEAFGKKTANNTLEIHTQGQLPLRFGYVLSRTEPASVKIETTQKAAIITTNHRGQQQSLILRHDTPPQVL
ncbi:MAG: alginate lyase family protein [Anaerolineales bacterium]|nr:alginate lyase family protein [Anaerolineales bacterium]